MIKIQLALTKKLEYFSPKSKNSCISILDSPLFPQYQSETEEQSLLFPISVGYNIFLDERIMNALFENLKALSFKGTYQFFISDSWHVFTYKSQKDFSNMIIESSSSDTDQFLKEKATYEGEDFMKFHDFF